MIYGVDVAASELPEFALFIRDNGDDLKMHGPRNGGHRPGVRPICEETDMDKRTATEEWRAAVGYEGFYEVSSFGRVRSLPRPYTSGRVLKPAALKYGHLHVDLRVNGTGKSKFVHSLVAEAFIGPCPDGMQVRHLDGNAGNNAVGNLTYGTPSENAYDRTRHGTNHNAAKTHCDNGHEFTEANTIPRGRFRQCRACHREHSREWARKSRLRKREEAT